MIPLGRNEPQNFVNTNKINQTSIVVLFLISLIFFSYHIIVDWSVFLLKQCSIVAPLILFPGSTTNCAIILKGIAENTAFYPDALPYFLPFTYLGKNFCIRVLAEKYIVNGYFSPSCWSQFPSFLSLKLIHFFSKIWGRKT